jgi:hypothetical protein
MLLLLLPLKLPPSLMLIPLPPQLLATADKAILQLLLLLMLDGTATATATTAAMADYSTTDC